MNNLSQQDKQGAFWSKRQQGINPKHSEKPTSTTAIEDNNVDLNNTMNTTTNLGRTLLDLTCLPYDEDVSFILNENRVTRDSKEQSFIMKNIFYNKDENKIKNANKEYFEPVMNAYAVSPSMYFLPTMAPNFPLEHPQIPSKLQHSFSLPQLTHTFHEFQLIPQNKKPVQTQRDINEINYELLNSFFNNQNLTEHQKIELEREKNEFEKVYQNFCFNQVKVPENDRNQFINLDNNGGDNHSFLEDLCVFLETNDIALTPSPLTPHLPNANQHNAPLQVKQPTSNFIKNLEPILNNCNKVIQNTQSAGVKSIVTSSHTIKNTTTTPENSPPFLTRTINSSGYWSDTPTPNNTKYQNLHIMNKNTFKETNIREAEKKENFEDKCESPCKTSAELCIHKGFIPHNREADFHSYENHIPEHYSNVHTFSDENLLNFHMKENEILNINNVCKQSITGSYENSQLKQNANNQAEKEEGKARKRKKTRHNYSKEHLELLEKEFKVRI